MNPEPVSDDVRRRFESQPRRDTKPELLLRRELHRRGLRYRVDFPLPMRRRTRGDIVFTRQQVAVFVDGCFWHRCPQHYVPPKNNADWWEAKIQRNVDRDREVDQLLEDHGWTSIRFWEHAVRDDPADCVSQVASAIRGGAIDGQQDG